MSITQHEQDLPHGLEFGSSVAVDTEAMGLNPARDRLCLVPDHPIIFTCRRLYQALRQVPH